MFYLVLVLFVLLSIWLSTLICGEDKYNWAILLAILTTAGIILSFYLRVTKKAKKNNNRAHLNKDNLSKSWVHQASQNSISNLSNSLLTTQIQGMQCPICYQVFDRSAKFCPDDGIALQPLLFQNSINLTGMICPKCHRGYDNNARFCPHDSEKLIPYSEWRLTRSNPGF